MKLVSTNTNDKIKTPVIAAANAASPVHMPESVAEYFECLVSVLGVELELWSCESKSKIIPSKQSSELTCSEINWDLNRELDSIVPLDDESSLLVVQIENFVACGRVSQEVTQPILQIAKLFRENHHQTLTIQSLNEDKLSLAEDNEQFLRQITADMEELTFLRQLCSFLELKSQNSDVVSELFSTVSNQVKSAWIGFIPKIVDDKPTPGFRSSVCLANPLGEQCEIRLTVEQLEQLIGVWQPGSQVVIENDVAAYEKSGEAFSHIDSFIICSVEKADQFFGWLIAVNRIQNIENDISFAPTSQKSEFGSVEAGLLSSAAATFATHFSNMDLLAANRQLLMDVVRCLVTAIESKDSYTCGHSERVARFGQRIAREIGLGEKEIERLYLSGLLHDVGKIGIPDSILLKTTSPTDEEFGAIKKHPEEGWKILQSVKQLDSILDGVLFHHERVDGKGYPDGLIGDEIPLHGKILAVADSFDAMTSDRPYRKGMPTSKAYRIIEEGADEQWDGEIVNAFLAITNEIESIKQEYRREPSPIRIQKTTRRKEE